MSRFGPEQVANLRSWGYEPRPDEIIQPPRPQEPPLSRWEAMAQEARADITVQAHARQGDQHNAYLMRLAQLMGERNR